MQRKTLPMPHPIPHHRIIKNATATKIAVAICLLVLLVLPSRRSLSAQATSRPRVLILGGGSSHQFDRMYGNIDANTLANAGDTARYMDSFTELRRELPSANVLVQASNQVPGPDPDTQRAILHFIDAGGGMIVVHAGTWYNWPGWPAYNRTLLGGGTHSHDKFGEFEVTVTAPQHPVMQGVPNHFTVSDELYHQEFDPKGSAVDVLATATSPVTGTIYPVLWVVKQGNGNIVCMTLGHDEKAHENPAYARVLVNAAAWAAKRSAPR